MTDLLTSLTQPPTYETTDDNLNVEQAVDVTDMDKIIKMLNNLFTGRANDVKIIQEQRALILEKDQTARDLVKELTETEDKLVDANEGLSYLENERHETDEKLEALTEENKVLNGQVQDLSQQVTRIWDRFDRLQVTFNDQFEELGKLRDDLELIRAGKMCFVCGARNKWTRNYGLFNKGFSIISHITSCRDPAHMAYCRGNSRNSI